MRKFGALALILVIVSMTALGFRDQTGQIDRKQLRTTLVQLGYEVNDINKEEGKEKYSISIAQDALNIPIGLEISPSNSYIWLTVNLGDAPAETSTKCLALLKQNAKIQPCFFYVTESGRMMMGLPVENHEIDNARIRNRLTIIADNVGKTKDIWQAAN